MRLEYGVTSCLFFFCFLLSIYFPIRMKRKRRKGKGWKRIFFLEKKQNGTDMNNDQFLFKKHDSITFFLHPASPLQSFPSFGILSGKPKAHYSLSFPCGGKKAGEFGHLLHSRKSAYFGVTSRKRTRGRKSRGVKDVIFSSSYCRVEREIHFLSLSIIHLTKSLFCTETDLGNNLNLRTLNYDLT